MGMLIGWLVGAAWLWFVIVLFTKRHDYDWKEMLLWVAIEGLAALPIGLIFMRSDDPGVAAYAMGLRAIVRAIVIYIILELRFQIPGIEMKLKIIGVYIGVRLVIALLLSVLSSSLGTM